MTIDDAIDDALGKTSPRSGMVASYGLRRGGQPIGQVEAHFQTHGSPNPQDWEITWIARWQSDGNAAANATSDDLEALLKQFGDIDLVAVTRDGRASECVH